ncbi:ABC transporter ATP-binding protein [Rhodovulum sp. DZ06]|uniref:ABC transporter ATP-binding protein n=1 Tax=Rhodovulum sp. DZ06 TaxID=3425126 RepID=UPI003D32DC0F
MRDVFPKLMDLMNARERRRFWLLMVMILVMAFSNMVGVAAIIPFLAVLGDPSMIETDSRLAWLYDAGGFTDTQGFLMTLGIAVFVVYLLSILIRMVTAYALQRYAAMRMFTISTRLLEGYLHQPYTWFLSRHSADLSKVILTEVGQVASALLRPSLNMIANGAVALFLLSLMVAVNPWAALMMFAVLGIGYGLVFAFARRTMKRIAGQRLEANQRRFRVTQDGLAGIKEIKVLGLEDATQRRFAKPAKVFSDTIFIESAIGELPRHLLEGIAFGGMMAVILVLMAMAEAGGEALITVLPVAGLYAVAGARLAPALQAVYRGINQIRFFIPALNEVHADFMGTRFEHRPEGEPFSKLREALVLKDVTYGYPGADRPALQNLSMTIPAGSSVGIVGGTGAGKTTAMDVILGLLSLEHGTLEVDGRVVASDADRRAWRRRLGYVPQQIFLTDESVAENIAFGEKPEDIDMARVEAAAKMAALHDFVVSDLPEGYRTPIGEGGGRLSGGQRQRIGIARVLYRNPDVLILDEATSALDNLTERAVMEAISDLGADKTVIMVAHRLSTVRNCDTIFLLEHGRVAAQGTYDELVAGNEVFRDMARDMG